MADKALSAIRGASRLPRSARRKQLLAAAQEVFVANGYHAAAMDEIAVRAGVSKPVLYQHFPGKLELYLALMDTQTEALRERITSKLIGTTDNQQRIHGVLTAYFDFVSSPENAGAFRLIFETDLGNDPAVSKRVDNAVNFATGAVAEIVAGDTGLDPKSAELLAAALTGAAQVAARWWLAQEDTVPKNEAVRLLEALLWRGISNFPRHD